MKGATQHPQSQRKLAMATNRLVQFVTRRPVTSTILGSLRASTRQSYRVLHTTSSFRAETKDYSHLKSEGDINLSDERTKWQKENIDPETQALLDEDSKYFLHQSLSTPCLNGMSKTEGIYIYDTAGRRYMDFHGNSVHQVGFSNPKVIEAIKNQLDTLPFCTRRFTNDVAVNLAKELVRLAPGDLNRVLFCPGGTGAIGMALKLARMATGRHKTISMWDSFHGASLDAISIGGEEVFRGNIGPLLPGTEHVPPADEYRCLWDCHTRGGCDLKCSNYIEYVLEKEGDVAAVIAEPIRWLPYIPRKEYWQRVREACDKHGALLIFDEIPNTLGRTGTMFTTEVFGVVPDILVVGKGLGGGVLPMAAMIAREHLNIAQDRALGHYTHEKNPTLCAAGLATLTYIQENNILEHVQEMGDWTKQKLVEMQSRQPIIGDVRGIGLLIGIELVRDRVTKERASDEAEKVLYKALSRGLSFKLTMGNIITLCPPLIINKDQMQEALDIIEDCLVEIQQEANA